MEIPLLITDELAEDMAAIALTDEESCELFAALAARFEADAEP